MKVRHLKKDRKKANEMKLIKRLLLKGDWKRIRWKIINQMIIFIEERKEKRNIHLVKMIIILSRGSYRAESELCISLSITYFRLGSSWNDFEGVLCISLVTI